LIRSLSLLVLFACGGDSRRPDQPVQVERIRLALNWYPEPEFGGFYEGVLSGVYKNAGFEVEIVPGGPGAPTLELLGTGQAEVAITAADDLLVKKARGINSIAVFAAFQWSPLGLMVHKSSGITEFGKIPEGAQVAIEVGGPFQTWLWKKYNWEGKVQAVPYGGSVGPFLTNPQTIQQAYITSEPCVAQSQGAQTDFLKSADAGWNPYGTVAAVRDPMPPWTERFVDATRQAWIDYLRYPDRANQEILRLNPDLKPEQIKCITAAQRVFIEGFDGLGAFSKDRWEETASNLRDLGLIPANMTALGLWKDFDETEIGPRKPEAPKPERPEDGPTAPTSP
jgi:NitT/TauT family transport system substrate-binding protein